MSRMKMVAGLALVSVLALGGVAEARPNYFNMAFKEMYANNAAALEAKCGVCHGEKKTIRNDYGMAVGKALGGPKVMDNDKVKEALKKVESEKSGTDGKTFGDLLKDGKLPGKLQLLATMEYFSQVTFSE